VTSRDLTRLGCALLVGAGLAFPAGLYVAGLAEGSPDRPPARAPAPAAVRDVYSPALRSDPWFLDRQRAGIEALERHCRQTGESCPEAREARRWFDEQAQGR
jgi:hypothetical protein